MRTRVLGMLAALPLVLSGCGDEAEPRAASSDASDSGCAAAVAPAPAPVAVLDLDGDGETEPVDYTPADGACPALLSATVRGENLVVEVHDNELPVTPADTAAVAVPGRTGDVLLVKPQHPRGGFQARLFGYADGKLDELTVDGKPVFDFVATDAMTTPTAATCRPGGFDVLQARAHDPIGVVPAWDIDRTTYTVDGNAVTQGATTEVADNVLDGKLRAKYSDLVDYRLFTNCHAPTQ